MAILFHLAVLAFGIQFTSALALSNMSSVYKFLGAPSSYLPYLGLAAPVSGLLIQPIIGQLSDLTVSRYGRRHPYIFGWTVLGMVACILFLFCNRLWLAVVLIWIINCSINGTVETLRALTGDIIPNKQKANAFSWQTIFAGLGAGTATVVLYVFSDLIPEDTSFLNHTVPWPIKLAFFVGGLIWFSSMYWTLKKTQEETENHLDRQEYLQKNRVIYILRLLGNTFKNIIINTKNMPAVIRELSLIQVFTWIGLYTMWLFFSLAISQRFYHLPLHTTNINTYNLLLEKGALRANFYFSIYQIVSVIYALLLIPLSKALSPKTIHGVSLTIGAIGLITTGLTQSVEVVIVCMVAIGIMWGSIMTLPYAIISAELPKEKMGVYLGLFNISVTLPQIIAGFILQPIFVYVFRYSATGIIVFSGLLLLTAGCITLYLFHYKDPDNIKFYQEKIAAVQAYFAKIKAAHVAHYENPVVNETLKKRLLLFIVLLISLSQLAITIYLPSMPTMAKTLNTYQSHIAISISIYLIGYGLSQFVYPLLAEIYGTRLMVLTGLSIFLLASAATIIAPTISSFLVVRFVQGLGAGCGYNMGRAVLYEYFVDQEFIRTIYRIALATCIAPVIGPVLGGYIQTFMGWRANFLVVLLYGAWVAWFALWHLPETKLKDQSNGTNLRNMFNTYWLVLRNRTFLGFFIPALACFSGELVYSMMSPFIIQGQMGWDPIDFGGLAFFIAMGFLSGIFAANLLSRYFSYRVMVLTGMIISIIAGVSMKVVFLLGYFNIVALIVPMMIFMAGAGTVYPNSNIGSLTPFTAITGIAAAIQGGLQLAVAGLFTIITERHGIFTPQTLALYLIFLPLCGFIVFYWLCRKTSNQ